MRYFFTFVIVSFIIAGMWLLNRYGSQIFPDPEMMACVENRPGYTMEGCNRAISGGRLWRRQKALAHNHRGNLYLQNRGLDKALNDYNEAVQLVPNLGIAYLNLCNAYLLKNKIDLAQAACEKGLTLEPDRALTHVFTGSVYGAKGDYTKALKHFAFALRLDFGSFPAWLERCKTWIKLVEYKKSDADCTRAIELKPGEAEPYFLRAFGRLQLGYHSDSLKDVQKSIALNPRFAKSHALLAAVYLALKKYEAANQSLDRALKLNANDPLSYYTRGRLHALLQKNEEALQDFRKAYALDPALAAAREGMAEIMIRTGRLDDALAALAEVIQKKPKSSRAYRGRCAIFAVKQAYDKALEACDKAVRVGLFDSEAWGLRTGVLLAKKDLQGAIESCRQGARVIPRHYLYYANCGRAYRFKGDRDEALAHLNSAIDLNPSALAALDNRARIYAEQGRWDLSARDHRQIVERSPKLVASVINNYAWALYKDGRAAKARPYAEQAVKLDPKADYAWGTLGEVLEALGENQKAVDCYKISNALDPKHQMSRNHLVRLGIIR